ncbi:MAG: hypothetical protein HOA38_03895 [Candidatus Marinimicrobia bacterium]|jgi:hypothetical protein|nr:hypothetical protein [Candidatus Neomarinimicrobiota bacterium]
MLEKARILKERYNSLSTPFLQEILWFHRIKADQDKELLTLEFLNVCASHAMVDKLFDKDLTTAKYRKDMQVRNILYNFPELESIVNSSDEEYIQWKNIETALQNKLELPYTYGYLRDRFASVSVFFTTISLLRKASLGMNTSRRWTSKFLFPFSFETLFIDVDNRKESFSMDRRFFSRGGEVLYMMISRAENADILKKLMQDIFQNPTQNKRWGSLLSTIRNNEDIYSDDIQLGFLSAESHEVFDQLVEDLISLLKSDIPHNDLFEHFASISSFYMVHFILTVALQKKQTSLLKSGNEKIVYPVELLAPRSDHVRRSSRQIYKINENLPLEALDKVFQDYMSTLTNITDKEELLKKIEIELNYKDDDDLNEIIDFDELKSKIFKAIAKKAKSDLLTIHRILLKGTGLASVKKTNSYRYLASDSWLKTLALINIDSRMPFNDFIDKLYEKYGFIIGSKHSILLIETYSDNDYKKNEARLFERLRALGLLESKSDGYAYVINRYGRK